MNSSSILFMKESHYNFSGSNTVLINHLNGCIVLNFMEISLELCYLLVKAKEQTFYTPINLNSDTLTHLNLALQKGLSLEMIIEKLSLGIDMSPDGWPIALMLFPVGNNSNLLQSISLRWLSFEEQVLLIFKTDSKIDYYAKTLSALDISSLASKSAANNDQLIADLKLDNEKLRVEFSQLEKKISQNSDFNNAAFTQLQIYYDETRVTQDTINSDLQIKCNQTLTHLEKFRSLFEAQKLKLDSLEKKVSQQKLGENINESLKTPSGPQKIGNKSQQIESSSQLDSANQIKESIVSLEKKIDAELFQLSLRLEEKQKNVSQSLNSCAQDLSATKLELSSTITFIRDLKITIEECISKQQESLKELKDEIDLIKSSVNFPQEIQEFSPVKDKFNSNLIYDAEEKHWSRMICCLNLNSSEFIVGCADGSVHFRDKYTYKITKSMPREHFDWIRSIIVVEDKLITGSRDEKIKIWSMNDLTKASISTISNEGKVFVLAHVRDQIIASGGSEKTIKLWEINSCTCLYTLKGHTNQIWGFLLYRNEPEILLSVGWDKSIRLWSIPTEITSSVMIRSIITEREMTSCLQLTKSTVIVGTRGPIDLWNIETGRLIKSLFGHGDWIRQLIWLSPNFICSCGDDKTIRIWDLDIWNGIKVLQGHAEGVLGLIRISSTQIGSVSFDSTARIWTAK